MSKINICNGNVVKYDPCSSKNYGNANVVKKLFQKEPWKIVSILKNVVLALTNPSKNENYTKKESFKKI